MWKNYTSLHTPLNIEKLRSHFAGRKISPVDIVLIIVGVITTVVLAVLLFMLYQKQMGAL